ncbi:protein adenylyltransferase SelO [Vibrio sonorensis]|uniref:protein adenylyltransferase SelO n=1 Tax=Vibrio sonorensis TaxID=1004316 RepID=UPI0008DA1A6B|nr:protein adenylyltransferase SelO family protein [Vibrio sonorensis]
MRNTDKQEMRIVNFSDFSKVADYSLIESLKVDPDGREDGIDHYPRQVLSGHYVPVAPTPIESPVYVSHSRALFSELGIQDELVLDDAFKRLFSADMSKCAEPLKQVGWATGYALSIYGNEYTEQCPFKTGNGYGDGRAISVFEGMFNGKRWEMQLKGGGPTPYCRGADGRAVLRSSVREFLAQEFMYALGIPSSRSLCLFTSLTERVDRPWYSENSQSENPDIMVSNPVAISTRVASSFLRVGQLELFSRRARTEANKNELDELTMIVRHVIDREYKDEIRPNLSETDQILELALAFRDRLATLITHWMRVGFCQGNFNSDNCSVGGFTLDYGPFGFCEHFDPYFQPWTGGGKHFSFFNQPAAAEKNFESFCSALRPLLKGEQSALERLDGINDSFEEVVQSKLVKMWASKLGLKEFDPELFNQLLKLMMGTHVDYTILFRELSDLPNCASALTKSFYATPSDELMEEWQKWLKIWRKTVLVDQSVDEVTRAMKRVNPKYTWREWLIVPAYTQAEKGDYSLIKELESVFADPYSENSKQVEEKFYRLKPLELFNTGGVSHYSCSS